MEAPAPNKGYAGSPGPAILRGMSSPRTLVLVALLAASLVPALPGAATVQNHRHAAITLSRTVGPVGAKVGVHGSGFAHRTRVSVRFRDAVRGVVEVASARTTKWGTFSVRFIVPPNPGGGHAVFAVDDQHRRSDNVTFTIRARVAASPAGVAPYDRVCAQLGLQPKGRYTTSFRLSGYPARAHIRIFLLTPDGTTVTAKVVQTDRFGSAAGSYVQPDVPSGPYKVRTSSPTDRFPTSVRIFSTWYTCYAFSGTARPMHWRVDGVGFLPGTTIRLMWSGSGHRHNPIFTTVVRADGSFGVDAFTTPCAPHPGRYTVRTIGTDGQGRPVFVRTRNRLRTSCG